MKPNSKAKLRGPADHCYAGVLLKGHDLHHLQHQFREKIKTASRMDNGAILVDFMNGSRNYTPSKSYQRVRSKHCADLKRKIERIAIPKRIRVKNGNQVEIVSQTFVSIRFSRRIEKLWMGLFFKAISSPTFDQLLN